MDWLTTLNTGLGLADTAISTFSSKEITGPEYEKHYQALLMGNEVSLPIGRDRSITTELSNVYLKEDYSGVFTHFDVDVTDPDIDTMKAKGEIEFIQLGLGGSPPFVNEFGFYHVGPYSWTVMADIDAATVGPVRFAQQGITKLLAWVFSDFQSELRAVFEATDTKPEWRLEDHAMAIWDEFNREKFPIVVDFEFEMLVSYIAFYICYRQGIDPPTYLRFDEAEVDLD